MSNPKYTDSPSFRAARNELIGWLVIFALMFGFFVLAILANS